jgi:tape measure domain-containing protein
LGQSIAGMVVTLGLDTSGFNKGIDRIQYAIRKQLGPEAKALSSSVTKVFTGLTAAMGLVGAKAVAMAADMEQTKIAFTTLLGSAEAANAFIGELESFAARTPFTLPGLLDASKKLLAFGFSAEEIIPMLTSVGDAAAGLGAGTEGIDRITRALGQMQAKGKVSAEEMNQLAELGIPGWEMLAEKIGVSIPEAMKLAQKNAIPAAAGISAIIEGMNSRFGGMMDKQSRTLSGLWSTLSDNIGSVMRSLGDRIVESLDLKKKLQGAVDWMTEFADAVRNNGIREALEKMIPENLQATIMIVTGAIIGAMVPALVGLAVAAAAAIVPLLPLIAAGAALGGIAYLVYRSWNPVVAWMKGAWEDLTFATAQAWSSIKIAVLTAIAAVLDYASRFLSILPGIGDKVAGFRDQVETLLADEKADKAIREIAHSVKSVAIAAGETTAPVKKAGDSLKVLGKTAKNSFKVAGSSGEEAFKKLQSQAEDFHNDVRSEWIQTTKTEREQLEYWYQEQTAKLESVRKASATYSQDRERLAESYQAKLAKLDKEELDREQKKMNDLVEMRKDFASRILELGDFSLDLQIGVGTGPGVFFDELEKEIRDKLGSMGTLFDDLGKKWIAATAAERDEILKMLNDSGIQYQITEDKKLDFSRARAEKELEIERYKQAKIQEYVESGQLIEDQLSALQRQRDLAGYAEFLNQKTALFLAQQEAEQGYFSLYREMMTAANKTWFSVQTDLYRAVWDSLSSGISDMILGISSAEDVFKSLGRQMLKILIDWQVQQILGAAIAKGLAAAATAASVVQAATIASAWATAAAMVSLATFGANSAAAMAGIAQTVAFSQGLAGIAGLASGGITTGPTLAVIGEGRYDEAVLPLNRRRLENLGLGGSGVQASMNIYGDIKTEADYEKIYADFGYSLKTALRRA